MNQEHDFYTYSAMEILKHQFGLIKPTHKQISAMKSILFHVWLKRSVRLDERLTQREKSCLYLASLGKTYKEIAEGLGIKPGTVKNHEKEILRKLSAKNMKQAISIVIRYDIIEKR